MRSVSKIKNILYNCNISHSVDRNLTIARDLSTNNSTRRDVDGEEGEKVVKQRTQTCVIRLPHRLGNLFQKTR